MSLFEDFSAPSPNNAGHQSPLAHRMAPRTFKEYIGQTHLIGRDKPLRKSIEKGFITSMILFGPPGTGKTALARIIATHIKAQFKWLNGATTGLEELKKVLTFARQNMARGQRTLLFLDEIHRFNRLQQDALLPDVEEGNLILIAATVENPFFYVNSALISRSQVYELKALSDDDTIQILRGALLDKDRGLGNSMVAISEDALKYIAQYAEGDARRALIALEFVVTISESKSERVTIDVTMIKDALQKKPVVYDRSGDHHYNNISAFIKSMRGSDPDATVYYLAKMLYAGEDPRFIARRIVICASEDVGNADPMALILATSALKAVDFVGMPEARIILSHAAIYIAKAPKSNACYTAIDAALKDVENERTLDVPDHLKVSHSKKMGYGKDYKYPHYYGGHVDQEYMAVKKKYYTG